jgi:hypothetical protein
VRGRELGGVGSLTRGVGEREKERGADGWGHVGTGKRAMAW